MPLTVMRPWFAPRMLVFLLLPSACAAGLAQGSARGGNDNWSAPLVGLHFTGSERYKAEEVERAAGLRRGADVSPADLKAAADRLASTGAFREVGYSYEPSGPGVVARYEVLDAEKWAPARFENLVWFTEEELFAHLHREVPLFQRRVPLGSQISDDIATALASLLQQRGIAGTVQHFPLADMAGNVLGVSYSVTGVNLPVEAVEFLGSSSQFAALLEKEARQLRGRGYSAAMIAAYSQHNFLPVYLSHGHLKAEFGVPQARIIAQDAAATRVAVSLPVREGSQYRLRELVIQGNRELSAVELAKTLGARVGSPMNAVQFEEKLEEVRKLYGKHGYIRAQTAVQQEFDEGSHAVTYTLSIREGELYRMGTVRVQGFEGADAERLARTYRQRQGEPFNMGYEWRVSSADLPPAYRSDPTRVRFTMQFEIDDATRTANVVLGAEVR